MNKISSVSNFTLRNHVYLALFTQEKNRVDTNGFKINLCRDEIENENDNTHVGMSLMKKKKKCLI